MCGEEDAEFEWESVYRSFRRNSSESLSLFSFMMLSLLSFSFYPSSSSFRLSIDVQEQEARGESLKRVSGCDNHTVLTCQGNWPKDASEPPTMREIRVDDLPQNGSLETGP